MKTSLSSLADEFAVIINDIFELFLLRHVRLLRELRKLYSAQCQLWSWWHKTYWENWNVYFVLYLREYTGCFWNNWQWYFKFVIKLINTRANILWVPQKIKTLSSAENYKLNSNNKVSNKFKIFCGALWLHNVIRSTVYEFSTTHFLIFIALYYNWVSLKLI